MNIAVRGKLVTTHSDRSDHTSKYTVEVRPHRLLSSLELCDTTYRDRRPGGRRNMINEQSD